MISYCFSAPDVRCISLLIRLQLLAKQRAVKLRQADERCAVVRGHAADGAGFRFRDAVGAGSGQLLALFGQTHALAALVVSGGKYEKPFGFELLEGGIDGLLRFMQKLAEPGLRIWALDTERIEDPERAFGQPILRTARR